MKKQSTNFDLLSEMHKDVKEIKEKLIPEIKEEIGVLKVKNSIWSSVTGVVGGLAAIVTLKLWK